MRSLIFVPALVICLFSCNTQEPIETKVISIKGQQIFKDTQFQYPYRLHVIDDLLLIENSDRMEPFFETYDLLSGKKLNDFGRRGNGPGEFISRGSVFYSSEFMKLFIYEPIRNQIFYLDKDELNSTHPELNVYQEIDLDGFFGVTVCILDSTFVVQGISREYDRLQFHPIPDGKLFRRGAYQENLVQGNIEGIDRYRKELSIQGSICANNKLNRLVSAYYYTDLLEVYDLDEDRIIGSSEFTQPIQRIFSGNRLNDIARINRDARTGYSKIILVKDWIFCLYSESTI
ncbi:MAG: hypothetical protein DRJ13_12725, partial [Bacteroidetes bacterium]